MLLLVTTYTSNHRTGSEEDGATAAWEVSALLYNAVCCFRRETFSMEGSLLCLQTRVYRRFWLCLSFPEREAKMSGCKNQRTLLTWQNQAAPSLTWGPPALHPLWLLPEAELQGLSG